MSFRRNSLYGLLGFVVPAGIVLVAYPVLVRGLGPEAFGIYLVATSMSGVLGFLDFGFSAATVQFIAEDMARGNQRAAAAVLATSLALYGTLGIAGAALIGSLAPWLVSVFSVAPSMQAPAVVVFRLAAVQFAAFFLITVYLSFFKGMHRFDLSALAIMGLSGLTYGGAVVGVKLGGVGVIGVTVISLTANLMILGAAGAVALWLCRSTGISPSLTGASLHTMRRMFGFGMFVAIEKTVAILTSQALRLVIAGFLGPVAVTVFVTAFTITSKIAAALRATFEVMMPATARLVQEGVHGSQRRLRGVYVKGASLSAVVGVAAMAGLYTHAARLITWWLRSPIAAEVTPLVKILCIGFAAHSATVVMYHMIAGLGRPVVNAAAAIVELVLIYAVVGVLALDGLSVSDFAVAVSVDLCAHAVFYVAFCEVVVWRRWIPRLMRNPNMEVAAL